MDKFKESRKLKIPDKREKKALTFQSLERHCERSQKVVNGFDINIRSIGKQKQGNACPGMLVLYPLDLAWVAKVSDPA